jgi:2Fe-2S ferredoxin
MKLKVIDRQGVEHLVDSPGTGTLMAVLRELDYGVAAICGGMCSCASCHVYVAPDWTARLPERHSDETELLAALLHSTGTSRLACQVELDEQLDGLCVTLAPEE